MTFNLILQLLTFCQTMNTFTYMSVILNCQLPRDKKKHEKGGSVDPVTISNLRTKISKHGSMKKLLLLKKLDPFLDQERNFQPSAELCPEKVTMDKCTQTCCSDFADVTLASVDDDQLKKTNVDSPSRTVDFADVTLASVDDDQLKKTNVDSPSRTVDFADVTLASVDDDQLKKTNVNSTPVLGKKRKAFMQLTKWGKRRRLDTL
jgi:hypothetical protein